MKVLVARSDTPAYGQLLGAVLRGEVAYVGEHIDPLGVKEIAVAPRARANPTIGIDRAYFTTVLKEYDDWRLKWWREAIQNAVDAGATKVSCEVAPQHDGSYIIVCQDNGSGMSEEVLRDKFLMLGATTKPGVEGASGGFGKAKELLLLPWLRWKVHTRDVVAEGSGIDYEVRAAPRLDGTRVEVLMPADQHTDIAPAQAFISKCYLPKVKFETVLYTPEGDVTRTEVAAKMKAKELFDRVEGKADVFVTKVDYDSWRMMVRVNGIFMFDTYVSETPKRQLICEITAPSIQILTANRDGFRDHEVRNMLSEIAEVVSKDVKSALKSRAGIVRKIYKGEGRFAADERAADAVSRMGPIGPLVRGRVEMLDPAIHRIMEVVDAWADGSLTGGTKLDALPTGDLAETLLRGVRFTGAYHVEQAIQQLVWAPDFYLINEIENFRVPKKFKPESMSPRVVKLVRTWTELCRYVLMQLGEFRPFGVGLMFSEDMGAAYSNDENQHWLLLNPFKDMRYRKDVWSPTKTDDLKWLYAAAIHECTHMADDIRYHDEDFASAMTRNVAKTADGFKIVRRISTQIRMGDEAKADVASNPEAVRRELLAF